MTRETAFAKINLALHVRGRRDDGYHDIETLFAFVDAGDTISAAPAPVDRVSVTGEFAGGLDNPFDNLVSKALSVLPRPQGLHLTLEKALPVAAGLGGGSADAGAVFRLVDRWHGLPADWQERASRLGADVPACVISEMAVGRGTGTALEPVTNDLAGTAVLLVNPRIALATGPVFEAWDNKDHGSLPDGPASAILAAGRNDLALPAITLCPAIAEVLGLLDSTTPIKAQMSGSGATCFALYDSAEQRDEAKRKIAGSRPDWWTMAGALR